MGLKYDLPQISRSSEEHYHIFGGPGADRSDYFYAPQVAHYSAKWNLNTKVLDLPRRTASLRGLRRRAGVAVSVILSPLYP